MVLVTLVTRNLRFVHTQPLGQFTLTKPLCYAQADKQPTNAVEVSNIVKLATFQPLVTFNFFNKLKVERFHGIGSPLDLIGAESARLELLALLIETTPFFLKARQCLLIFAFVTNHGSPPNLDYALRLTVPTRLPESRRKLQFISIEVTNTRMLTVVGVELDAVAMPHG